MVQELHHLRLQIDQLDRELVQLLARRLQLVDDVGKIKKRNQLPDYDAQREAEIITTARCQADLLGISPDLVTDVLHRVIRESVSIPVE